MNFVFVLVNGQNQIKKRLTSLTYYRETVKYRSKNAFTNDQICFDLERVYISSMLVNVSAWQGRNQRSPSNVNHLFSGRFTCLFSFVCLFLMPQFNGDYRPFHLSHILSTCISCLIKFIFPTNFYQRPMLTCI